MRQILRGFTMYLDGVDYGDVISEFEEPVINQVRQEFRGGGMNMGVNLRMSATEPMAVTFKVTGHIPALKKCLGTAPGVRKRFTFRQATVDELDNGKTHALIYIFEGALSEGSADTSKRGDLSGLEYVIDDIIYYQHRMDDEIVHSLAAWPPECIIGGVDQLKNINEALGR